MICVPSTQAANKPADRVVHLRILPGLIEDSDLGGVGRRIREIEVLDGVDDDLELDRE